MYDGAFTVALTLALALGRHGSRGQLRTSISSFHCTVVILHHHITRTGVRSIPYCSFDTDDGQPLGVQHRLQVHHIILYQTCPCAPNWHQTFTSPLSILTKNGGASAGKSCSHMQRCISHPPPCDPAGGNIDSATVSQQKQRQPTKSLDSRSAL